MTEQQWLACSDTQTILKFLATTQKNRKLRLFAVECRLLLPFISDPHSRKALRLAERYAEGQASSEKLRFAWESARRAATTSRRRHQEATPQDEALWAVSLVVEEDFSRLGWLGDCINRAFACAQKAGLLTTAPIDEVGLIRDIVGNPFRPVAINSAWLAWNDATVLRIAQSIYAERAFDRMPILSDALKDAGCTNADILSHCRQSGTHARGCWAVDLILGNE